MRGHCQKGACGWELDGSCECTCAECRVLVIQFRLLGLEGVLARTVDDAERRIRQAFQDGIVAAAKLVEGHSCVSSCCDANPSSGEAAHLAECIRKNAASRKPQFVELSPEDGEP